MTHRREKVGSEGVIERQKNRFGAAAQRSDSVYHTEKPIRVGTWSGFQLKMASIAVVALLVAGCGKGDAGQTVAPSETGGNVTEAPISGNGDSTAFRMGQAGWENTCTVITPEEVETATGFTVLDAQEVGGCEWTIESFDPDIPEGSAVSISWLPMMKRQPDIQREAGPRADSGLIYEDLEIGEAAYWQGYENFPLGEVWVQLDQLSFRVVNQFTTPSYEGDTRSPMVALASAIAESVGAMDVIAASGEFGAGLVEITEIDVPEGIALTNALMSELEGFPVPDDAVLENGSDMGGRANQAILTKQAVGDATRFYLEALPAAGYEIHASSQVSSEDDVTEWAPNLIEFIDPQGRRGHMTIAIGPFSPTKIGVEVVLE